MDDDRLDRALMVAIVAAVVGVAVLAASVGVGFLYAVFTGQIH